MNTDKEADVALKKGEKMHLSDVRFKEVVSAVNLHSFFFTLFFFFYRNL